MKKNIIKRKGFTLIEVLVSMFIFVIIITATVGFFGRAIMTYSRIREVQKNLERAQFAMNTIAKSLRNGSVVKCNDVACVPDSQVLAQKIKVYDYGQGACVEYQFDGNAVKYWKSSIYPIDSEIVDNITDCRDVKQEGDGSDPDDLISQPDLVKEGVNGWFHVVQSGGTTTPVGKVTISAEACAGSCSGNTDRAKIQSAVSTRDFEISMP